MRRFVCVNAHVCTQVVDRPRVQERAGRPHAGPTGLGLGLGLTNRLGSATNLLSVMRMPSMGVRAAAAVLGGGEGGEGGGGAWGTGNWRRGSLLRMAGLGGVGEEERGSGGRGVGGGVEAGEGGDGSERGSGGGGRGRGSGRRGVGGRFVAALKRAWG